MATKFVSERNLKFLLYEVFDIEALTRYDYYRDHNKKTFDMVLKEGLRLAMDLLGRKVTMKNGQAWTFYLEELEQAISQANEISDLKAFAGKLDEAVNQLKTTTGFLMGLATEKSPEIFLADATLYLEFFGIVTIAWQWLLQGIAAQKALTGNPKESELNFYNGKMATLKYFYLYELPKILGLQKRLINADGLTVKMDAALFND